jgi:hypothetical protein
MKKLECGSVMGCCSIDQGKRLLLDLYGFSYMQVHQLTPWGIDVVLQAPAYLGYFV